MPPLKRARRHATPQPQQSPPLHASLASFAEAYAQGRAESLGLRPPGSSAADSALETSNIDISMMLRLFPETALAQHMSEAAEKLPNPGASCQAPESYVWPEAAGKVPSLGNSRLSHRHTQPGEAAEKPSQSDASCQPRAPSLLVTKRTTRASSANDLSSVGNHESSAAVRHASPAVRPASPAVTQIRQRNRKGSRWDQPAPQKRNCTAVSQAPLAVSQAPTAASQAYPCINFTQPSKRRGGRWDIPPVRQASPAVGHAQAAAQQQDSATVRGALPGVGEAQPVTQQQQDGAAVGRASPGVRQAQCTTQQQQQGSAVRHVSPAVRQAGATARQKEADNILYRMKSRLNGVIVSEVRSTRLLTH